MERREFLKASAAASAVFSSSVDAKKETQGEQPDQFYAVIELMGHKRLAGRVTTGSPLYRIDVPVAGGFVTQFVNPHSIYRLSVTDEQCVREMAKGVDPLPTLTLDYDVVQRRIDYEPY